MRLIRFAAFAPLFLASSAFAFGDMSQPGTGPGVSIAGSTGTFSLVQATATGSGNWSIISSSGILVQGTGEVRSAIFAGELKGNAATVTNGMYTNSHNSPSVHQSMPNGLTVSSVSATEFRAGGSSLTDNMLSSKSQHFYIRPLDGGYNLYLNDTGSGNAIISGAGANVLIPHASSKIGIGTSSPASKLHISSGTFTVDGNVAQGIHLVTGSMGFASDTEANIQIKDPVRAGEAWYCSDCSAAALCVSTGTALGDWSDSGDRTARCD